MPSTFYNFSKLLSYNATYNHAVGGRGIGKTYGAKKKAIKDALKNLESGDQFIYLRRYKKELQISRDTFFADIQHEFKAFDFRINGYFAQAAPADTRDDKKREWYTIGYFIALSVAQTYKSVAFPRVKTIVFDEYVIEKGAIHYLPDEAKVFNNFFSTVDRYKDKTRVFFLANSVSITNPYFIEYHVNPNNADASGILKMFDGFMIVHFIDSEEFKNEVYQTKFGKFIAGTEYADYAVENEFIDNNDSMIERKPSSALYVLTLETSTGIFSVWYDAKQSRYYCQIDRPGNEILFTMVNDKMSEDKTLVTFNDKTVARLRSAYRNGRMRFDVASVRNAFIETFKR
jgi:hypothetical protein